MPVKSKTQQFQATLNMKQYVMWTFFLTSCVPENHLVEFV